MGRSLLTLLQSPNKDTERWNASYSQIARGDGVQGLSMRVDQWRITRWTLVDAVDGRPQFNLPDHGVELYAHTGDTEMDYDAYENANLATVAAYNATMQELLSLLESTWDNGKLPPATPHPSPSPSPFPPHPQSPRYQLQAVVAPGAASLAAASCLSVAGAASDAVQIAACSSGGINTEWVTQEFADTTSNTSKQTMLATKSSQTASLGAGGMCLNIYGGVDHGCSDGARVHLNTCSGYHAGNAIAFVALEGAASPMLPHCVFALCHTTCDHCSPTFPRTLPFTVSSRWCLFHVFRDVLCLAFALPSGSEGAAAKPQLGE